MTDSSYKARGNGERPVQEEDDPLMQLSQIGGFDELFSAQSKHSDTTPSDDMFAIDLERELVGSLDDDFFGHDVPDVFADVSAPSPTAPDVAAAAADHFRDSYRSASARSYASYNQGSHGYGSLTQHLQSQSASAGIAQKENLSVNEESAQTGFATQETPVTQELYSYADEAYNSALEDELALALSGHEDVLSSQYQSSQSSYQSETEYEPQQLKDYQPPAAVVPAQSLEDELANLLFGDAVPSSDEEPAAHEEPRVSEKSISVNTQEQTLTSEVQDEAFSSFVLLSEDHEPLSDVDDFAAQFSIESGNYQPASIQAPSDEPSLVATSKEDVYHHEGASYQEPISSIVPRHNSGELSQDILFDDTSFTVETSDTELNALNQASAEFEATLANLPQDDAFELDDDNFSEAIERELSAQSYFPWEKDKTQLDEQEIADPAYNTPSETFFSDQDFDFGIEETELRDASKVAEKAPVFAHAISEEGHKPAPFPHYTSQRSTFSVPAPDVETMSVAESKVEQTQPLDLPDVPYYDEPDNAGLNQLEAEFADVFSSVNVEEKPASVEEAASVDRAFEDIFRETYADFSPTNTPLAAGGLAAGAAALGATKQASAPQISTGHQDDFYNHWADSSKGSDAQQSGVAPYSLDEDLSAAADAYRERPVRGRRALMFATAAGVLVLIGGIAYHFIGGGMNSGEPVIIRSDNQPVKVQPDSPGGATVPNQDKAVYERVAGTIPQNPEQKSLVTAQEDPVDLAADEDEFGSFDDGRNDTIIANNNTAIEEEPLIVPRTVQTMVVRPDGTIVQQPADTMRTVTPVAPEPEALTPENIIEASPLTPAETVSTQTNTPVAPARTVETQTFTPPAQVPVVPSRPAQQPVVANTPATPAVSETSAASPAGGYYIQIASQPSAQLAQKSFASMGQKYANIIGGRAVDIRKADIPGKGTYYRVRISAGTKAEANALCARLKNAGGNCFVTQ